MSRNKKPGEENEDGAESDGSDITTESAKERRAKIKIPNKLINVLNEMQAKSEELLKQVDIREFLKPTFDFEQRYDEEIIDDLDYDKMIEDAEARTGIRKDKQMLNDHKGKKGTKLVVKKGGKGAMNQNKPGEGGNFSAGTVGMNDFRQKAVAALGLKYTNSTSKKGSKGNLVAFVEGIEKKEEVPLTEEEIEKKKQEEARAAQLAAFQKGFQQSLKEYLGGGVRMGNKPTKEYLLDRLREAKAEPIGKWDTQSNSQKTGGKALNRSESHGGLRRSANKKSALKKQDSSKKSSSQSDSNTSDDSEEENDSSDDDDDEEEDEELDPEKLKDAIQDEDLVFETREITEIEEIIDESGQVQKITKRVVKKIPVLKKRQREIATQTGETEPSRSGKKKKTKKVLEQVEVYEEVEVTGPNGEKIKKLVPVIKTIVKEVERKPKGNKKRKNKKLKRVRVDSVDAIYETEEPSTGRSSLKNFILYQEGGKPVKIKRKKKKKILGEGENYEANENSISLYDMLANANMFELDSK